MCANAFRLYLRAQAPITLFEPTRLRMGASEQTESANPYEPTRILEDIPAKSKSPTRGIDLSRENPLLTVWTRPRATIRGIVDTEPTRWVMPLALTSGIVQTLNNATQRNAGDTLPLGAILGMVLVLGPIGGVVSLYLGAFFIGLSCRWLGGRANSTEVRAALAWCGVPTLATIPIWLLQLGIFGREMFTSEMPSVEANPMLSILVVGTGIVEVILGIWSFVILLKMLGEVEGFSAWKALGALLLLMLAIIVPLVILAVVVLFVFTGARG